MVRFIERATPPGSRIFSFEVPPYAYCSREFVPGYYSAMSLRLRDCIFAGIDESLQPLQVLTFRISPQRLRGLRLVETGTTSPVTPGITEVRILGPNAELRANPTWHLNAYPFPWDISLAFDQSLATRWKAWEPVAKGSLGPSRFWGRGDSEYRAARNHVGSVFC